MITGLQPATGDPDFDFLMFVRIRLMKKMVLPSPDTALPGREQALAITGIHAVLKSSMKPPFPSGYEVVFFGLGCFWGAERLFWQMEGVYTTAVGYQGGFTPNPTYEEVCSGNTGHVEIVMVVFDPEAVSLDELLTVFWESHDPTQGMRQGNDRGTQYRSAIYTTNEEQSNRVLDSRQVFQAQLLNQGFGEITTEIKNASSFYYAEEWHQQYLDKNPDGYCGLKGTGVSCPF